MKRKEYLEKRNELLAKAQKLLNENKLEELKSVKSEIEMLDKNFEEVSKEQANIEALKDKVALPNLSNESVDLKNAKVVSEIKPEATIDYETVFAKVALKRQLNSAEIEVFNKFNPENTYTHTTENTEVVIPKSVILGIENQMTKMHPILADVIPTHIKGTVSYPKHKAIIAGDADYYGEDEETEDENNDFGELTLGGKELSKAVSVSWKLQAMAVEEFIPYIERELAKRMGAAKARAFVNGAGNTKYPQGVITAIKAESQTPQKIEYAATGLTYEKLTEAMGVIGSQYKQGAKIYANNKTVWGQLANVKDEEGHPIFIPDVTAGGVGRIFGLPVYEEAALGDNEILAGNMAAGYKENIQEDTKLVTDQRAKKRKTDFVGYQVHDAGVVAEQAFAYLVKAV